VADEFADAQHALRRLGADLVVCSGHGVLYLSLLDFARDTAD